MCRAAAHPVEVPVAELVRDRDDSRSHGPVLVGPLRPGQSIPGIHPQSETHTLAAFKPFGGLLFGIITRKFRIEPAVLWYWAKED
jgi:hypothetical protein